MNKKSPQFGVSSRFHGEVMVDMEGFSSRVQSWIDDLMLLPTSDVNVGL